jgi:hypothetical protein
MARSFVGLHGSPQWGATSRNRRGQRRPDPVAELRVFDLRMFMRGPA